MRSARRRRHLLATTGLKAAIAESPAKAGAMATTMVEAETTATAEDQAAMAVEAVVRKTIAVT